jgi:hypothetical protein
LFAMKDFDHGLLVDFHHGTIGLSKGLTSLCLAKILSALKSTACTPSSAPQPRYLRPLLTCRYLGLWLGLLLRC